MTRSVYVALLLATAANLAIPAVAKAEDAAVDAVGRENEVVVTARRRAENIQDVPISVQAINGETLERKGASICKA